MFRPRHFAATLFKPRLFPGGGGVLPPIVQRRGHYRGMMVNLNRLTRP